MFSQPGHHQLDGQIGKTTRLLLPGGRRAILIPRVSQAYPNPADSQPHEVWDGPAGGRAALYFMPDLRRVGEIYSSGADAPAPQGTSKPAEQPQLFEVPASAPWSFQHAWSMGHRVGVVAGSGNHLGTPGLDNYAPSVLQSGGLTVVFAPELTREAVFEALYQRRCYATTGARLLLDFAASGSPMGSELQKKQGERLAFTLSVTGTAPLTSVEVLKYVGGDIVTYKSAPVTGTTAALSFAEPVDQGTLYYVRVRQTDGEMAWSSPIWVDAI